MDFEKEHFEDDNELFEGEIFAFAVADTIEGGAKADIHQVRHQPGAQQAGFAQAAACVEHEQRIEPQPLEEFGGLSFASEKVGARAFAKALESKPRMLEIDLWQCTRVAIHGIGGGGVKVRP